MGLAKTGIAVARFLAQRGARVIATDMRNATTLSGITTELANDAIQLVLGEHRLQDFTLVDMVVTSPGVPQDHPMLRAALAAHIPIISEIELACRFITAPLIAITGTNGKTTTTTITGEIFKANGFNTFVGGNIGDPLINLVTAQSPIDRVVVEVSSFQLEWIQQFRPQVAALLNLSEDHLDRYQCYDDYINAKMRIFENQLSTDIAVVNYDDPAVWERTSTLRAERLPFSRVTELEHGIFYTNERIIFRRNGNEQVFSTNNIALTGVHNIENIMAALAATLVTGCTQQPTQQSLNELQPLHHRMEFVAEKRGVRFYEDSKATNVGSVVKALESFDSIILIAGGKDKGGSYAPMLPMVTARVRHMVLIGEAAARMEQELGSGTTVHRAATIEDAVHQAATLAQPGDAVLLSPACSSFDMFRDYEERAQRFIAAVMELNG